MLGPEYFIPISPNISIKDEIERIINFSKPKFENLNFNSNEWELFLSSASNLDPIHEENATYKKIPWKWNQSNNKITISFLKRQIFNQRIL